jgi:peptidyl-tRNA hydrolase, PTH1 family
MKLIIGLGNPGKSYENTRHNVGFLMVDQLFSDWKEEKKFKSMVAGTWIFHSSSWTMGIKPQTFMNLSGDAVTALVSFYKLDPKKDILVISDDIDMEFGKVRFRTTGSHGGQNWLRDIIAKLWTSEFARLKIGIGRDDRYEVSDWVLSRFQGAEIDVLQIDVLQKVQEYITIWLWD